MQTLLKVYPLSFSGKCIFTVRLASRPCDTRKHRSFSLSLVHFSSLSLSFPSYEYDRREKARGDRLCVCRGRALSDQCHGTAWHLLFLHGWKLIDGKKSLKSRSQNKLWELERVRSTARGGWMHMLINKNNWKLIKR